MIETIFSILQSALHIWEDKEKTKYLDKLMSLKKDYYEEYNKPLAERSDAVLDNISFELRILGTAFSASVGTPNAPNKP